MGTIVLLAAFVIAASATPIEKILDSSTGESPSPHEEDTPAPDIEADSVTATQHGKDRHDEEPQHTNDFTVDEGGNRNEEHENHNEWSASSGDSNTNNDEGDNSTTSNDSVSATSTEDGKDHHDEQPQQTNDLTVDEGGNRNEEHANNNESSASSGDSNTNIDEGDDSTTSNDSVSATSTEGSTEVNTGNKSDVQATPTDGLPVAPEDNTRNNNADTAPTSSVSTASVTSTIPEIPTPQNNDLVSPPDDADRTDCRNATEKNHTYVMCTYSCQGDEVFTAPDNSSCYIYPANVTTDILIEEEYNNKKHEAIGIGICIQGGCVQNSSEVPAAPTESSPDNSTQQRNESYTTPSDADPKDCRNATETNHTYVMCTYSCQGDEMFTAPDNSSCYIYPRNVTPELLLSAQYDHLDNKPIKTGVCYQGNCFSSWAVATATTTESSPAEDTSSLTASDTQSTISGQPSAMPDQPNSESFPGPSPPTNTSTGHIGAPDVPLNNAPPVQEDGNSTTVTNSPVALPAMA